MKAIFIGFSWLEEYTEAAVSVTPGSYSTVNSLGVACFSVYRKPQSDIDWNSS
jgi:hypothetical protein